MLGLWALITLWQQWGQWAEDLSAVYMAGWLWHTGETAVVYDSPSGFLGGVAQTWLPAMEALGIAERTTYAYIYPPIWAVLPSRLP